MSAVELLIQKLEAAASSATDPKIRAALLAQAKGYRAGAAKKLRPKEPRLTHAELKLVCSLCAEGWLPPHYASDRCQSGRKEHCSCSSCFD